MNRILLVEDNKIFLNLIQKQISEKLDFECVSAKSFEETRDILENDPPAFLLAVLDLDLPDAPNGEIVEYVLSNGIPTIVLTALINDDVRDQIMTHRVIDYIIKQGSQSLTILTNTIQRFVRNQQISILVVDDSGLARKTVRRLLKRHNFNVLEAQSGKEAIELLRKDSTIRCIIADYHMPEMNGFELTAAIRQERPIDELGIIGMSAMGNPILSAQFLKNGANDFINKPFHDEEFLWRVQQNVEMLDNIRKLKDAAVRDYLTGLYNRRHFFDIGDKLLESAKRKHLHVSIGMIDIDHFKEVNDTYGHHVGDYVIQHFANVLQQNFRASDIVARFGGEEFVVLTVNMAPETYLFHFESLRKKVAQSVIQTPGGDVQVTISIGVTTQLVDSLDDMIKNADDLLYQAKNGGRNKVVIQ